MPETTHPKTYAGTVCHEVFEYLGDPDRRGELEAFKDNGYRIEGIKILEDMTNDLIEKFEIIESVAIPIPDMIMVGGEYLYEAVTNPDVERYIPEYEFTLKTDKYEIKGFIDLLIIYKDGTCLIADYKSQGKKFTGEKMKFNVQALVYQLAVFKEMGLKPAVNFIMLRYPATTRTPDKHIQRVEWVGESDLEGLEEYLAYTYEYLATFNEEKASSNFCKDNPKNQWFCQYVCQYKTPLDYYSYSDTEGNVLKTSIESLPKEDRPEKSFEQFVNFKGCPKFN